MRFIWNNMPKFERTYILFSGFSTNCFLIIMLIWYHVYNLSFFQDSISNLNLYMLKVGGGHAETLIDCLTLTWKLGLIAFDLYCFGSNLHCPGCKSSLFSIYPSKKSVKMRTMLNFIILRYVFFFNSNNKYNSWDFPSHLTLALIIFF